MLEAKLRFFEIQRCGFYQRAASAPEFSGINDTINKLATWATDGREFVNTTTYEPNYDNDLLNTYFYSASINNNNNDSILVLWNESPNDNGVLYGINPQDIPGTTTEMLATDFGGMPAIPGAPSYFWFIPERNVFASIRFEHSISGKKNLDQYLNGYLSNKSPYRVLDPEGSVIGFSPDGRANEDNPTYYSKFLSRTSKQEDLEAELLANIHKIRKFIKRETLSYQLPDDRNVVERVFSQLLDNAPSFSDSRIISHEIQFQPTETQLRGIIRNYSERDSDTSLRNAGFMYNDGRTVMLNGLNVGMSIELELNRYDNQIVAPMDLLNAITSVRAQLLSILS
ncbi:hypothetical protein NQT74_04800 [Alteromonas stellipolaris]|uniref:hypothetical protein n=1 Tax=Alteromonas stellipolaris TaxID=233316 RepID=UPI0021192DFF|nr:hypothetical protein [Alteromonas stellipolaris]MCQ8847888.1 hypothetical protein [Alteromonas stellipolaris]